jgi:hypothetical protein
LPLVPLVNAGGPEVPMEEHPWEEVKSVLPPRFQNPELTPSVRSIYFFSVSPLHISLFMLVVEQNYQEVVKKDLSAKTMSLPRKK